MKFKKNIWLISKYLNLPVNGSFPGRGFSLLREFTKEGYNCCLFVADHDFFTFSNILSHDSIDIEGIKVIKIKVINYKKAKSISRIIGWIQFELKLFFLKKRLLPKPDILICSSLSILSILNGILMKWRYSSKLVFEVRDIWPMVLVENGGFSKFNPFVIGLQVIEWLGYKFSDEIVGTMPRLDIHVEKVINAKKNVTCIPMGICEELLNQEVKLPDHLNSFFPEEKFIVTYAGSIGIDNALDTFFESIHDLQHEENIVFRIVGGGDFLEKYKKKCKQLNNVDFLGKIENELIQGILKKSSILYFAAHPTKVLDFGQSLNKVIDYMYSGKPIIASYSGYQSMVNEAESGFFVPAGNKESLSRKIVELSKISYNELDEMGKKGKKWLLENRKYSFLAKDYQRIF
jgi:glycosyltransferase involved in cell wall biosynthesis